MFSRSSTVKQVIYIYTVYDHVCFVDAEKEVSRLRSLTEVSLFFFFFSPQIISIYKSYL